MKRFTVGSRAWAMVKDQTICTNGLIGTNTQSFLVIGASEHWRVLLAEPPYVGKPCTLSLCTSYGINSYYLGKLVILIRPWHLLYAGRTCGSCQSQFDYLPAQTDFVCWKCEL